MEQKNRNWIPRGGTGVLALILFPAFAEGQVKSTVQPKPTKRVSTAPVKPTEECLRSPEALRECLENGVIDQAQYDYYFTFAEMNAKHEIMAQNTRYSKLHYILQVPNRCEGDSLTPPEAPGRTQWALNCVPFQAPFVTEALTTLLKKVEGGRPMYPTFNRRITGEGEGAQFAEKLVTPTSPDVACEAIIPGEAVSWMSKLMKDHFISSFCVSSCWTPEQKLLLASGLTPIADAKFEPKVVRTLTPNASRESLQLKDTPVQDWVESEVPVWHDIVKIETAAGRRLSVTTNHPLVAADGTVRDASTFRVGDALIEESGKLDPIVAVRAEKFHGLVYNLFTESSDLQENVIVSEGVLQGTAFYQNQITDKINRVLFREQLPESLVNLAARG